MAGVSEDLDQNDLYMDFEDFMEDDEAEAQRRPIPLATCYLFLFFFLLLQAPHHTRMNILQRDE